VLKRVPDDELRRIADAARTIKRFLTDEYVREVIENLRHEYYRKWEQSPPSAADERERVYAKMCALNDLIRALQSRADMEEVALQELNRR